MVEKMGKLNLDGLDNDQVSFELSCHTGLDETQPVTDDEATTISN